MSAEGVVHDPARRRASARRSLALAGVLIASLVVTGLGATRAHATDLPFNPGDVRDCANFRTWNEAQAWYETYYPFFGDIGDLDPDGDGIPCESLPNSPRVSPRPPATGAGYWMLERTGTVFGFGDANPLVPKVGGLSVAMAAAPNGGYWVLGAAGTVEARSATWYGNLPSGALSLPGEAPIAITGTPDGAGYWIVTTRGRVVAFGAAPWSGDVSGLELNAPIVGASSTPSGHGYWLVASDGGIFAFGDAAFSGSMGGSYLSEPVVGIAADPDGLGYLLVGSDGGVFAFDVVFRGSVPGALLPGQHVNEPVVGALSYGNGYVVVARDGGIFSFSDQPFLGSLGGSPTTAPIMAVAVRR